MTKCTVFLLLMLLPTRSALANEINAKTFSCPSKSHDFIKSYKINEEAVSFVLCNEQAVIPPKAEDQQSVSQLHFAKDNKSVGWAVNVPNCCTSYPIPTFLNIYYSGEIYTVNSDGQMIWNWYFSPRKGKVILEEGTVHGMNEPNINEYDIKTGKQLRHIKDGK